MPRKRKRAHAPDPFQRTFRAFYWGLSRAGWFVVAGAVSLVFILVGFAFLSLALEEAEDAAWEELDRASTPDEMEEVARDYARSVGPQAYLRLGNMLFNEAQEATDAGEKRALFARARGAFSKGARLFPKHFLTAYLLEGEGLCLEEMGMHEDAVGIFQRAIAADPKGHLALKLESDVGRNLVLLGDEEEAVYYLERAVYPEVRVDVGLEADWLLNARLLLARIGSKETDAPPARDEGAVPEAEETPPEKPEADAPAAEAAPEAPGPEEARPEPPAPE